MADGAEHVEVPEREVSAHDCITTDESIEASFFAVTQRTRLIIAYEVMNKSQSTILLCGQSEGPQRTLHAGIYTFVEPSGVLHVTKREWPLPDHIDVYAPYETILTSLGPGHRFRERIELPIPIALHHPYKFVQTARSAPRHLTEDKTRGLIFSIAYVNENERLSPCGASIGCKTEECQRVLQLEFMTIKVSVVVSRTTRTAESYDGR